jgi:tetratricopeptide (TPR) repeat protein
MYFRSSDYLKMACVDLALEHIEFLRKKYMTHDFIQDFIEEIFETIKLVMYFDQILKTWYKTGPFSCLSEDFREGDFQTFTEYLANFDTCRNQMDIEDYYFLKAAILIGHKESIELLEMLKMLFPQDARIQLALRLKTENGQIENIICDLADKCPALSLNQNVKNLYKMARLIVEFVQNPEKFPVQRLLEIIEIDVRLNGLVYSLIYEDVVKKPAKYQLKLINIFEENSTVAPEYFNMARCHVLYHTGNKAEAHRLIDKIDVESFNYYHYYQVANRILKTKIYKESGEKEKATQVLKNLFKYDDFRFCRTYQYFWSLINLAKLYVECGQPHLARKTIIQHNSWDMNIILIFHGAEYFSLKGNIYLAEKKKRKAILMFKKSLALREHPEIRDKLKMLEMRLN